MADDKLNEIDDWLKDLDEPGEAGGNSDGGQGIESLLADEPAGAESPSNHASIDALFTDTPPENKPENQAEQPVPAPATTTAPGLIDQADIDSLLNAGQASGPETGPEAAAPSSEAELLDQSDIDSLFADNAADGKPGDQAKPADDAVPGLDDFSELDQADIDSLFADPGDKKMPPPAEEPPSQEEIDRMFAARGAGDQARKGPPEKEALPASGSNAFDFFDEAADFDKDTDRLPDIPEETAVPGNEQLEVGEVFAGAAASTELAAALSDQDGPAPSASGKRKKSLRLPVLLAGGGKKRLAVLAAALSLAGIAAGLYFSVPGKKTAAPVPAPADIQPPPADGQAEKEEKNGPPPAAPPTPELPAFPTAAAPNAPPNIGDVALQLDEKTGTVPVRLSGEDAEGDALQFVVTDPPQYGRLSGTPPELTYLPSTNFPGSDQFVYRASDGKDVSPSATVVISGPDLRQVKTQEGPAPVPDRAPAAPAPVAAKEITLTTASGKDLLINWKSIWKAANRSAFGTSVTVEIFGKPKLGVLKKTGPAQHLYRTEPFTSGTETLTYRFRKNDLVSRKKTLRLVVEVGDPRPEIRLQPLAESYPAGETVLIDAGGTRDDRPETLTFTWEQTDGVPVRIRPVNQAASAISFVVPASFHTANYPDPTIKLTVTDRAGQSDTAEIRVRTKSRRSKALWNQEPQE